MTPKTLKKKSSSLRLLAPAAVLGLLAACGGTPTRYYTLAESTPPAAAQRSTADTAALAIEMAPVALPERLARPQLVVRRSGGMLPLRDASEAEVDVLEQSRWSSSFEYELRDALAAGIAGRLSAFDATKAGRPRGIPVYRIAVQLRDFDAQPGTRVDSAFGWSIRRGDGDALLTCQMRLSEAVSGGVDGVAVGAQRITGRLADEIARNVGALAANQAANCPAA
ncbi:PqiC family protein [Variovorax soli]|uniref:PqiC family protein n=1 Tax=Variovorax soli TaxID=376815 RepID=UPI000838ABC6|nr:PqiC family protein [Variovorax soli]